MSLRSLQRVLTFASSNATRKTTLLTQQSPSRDLRQRQTMAERSGKSLTQKKQKRLHGVGVTDIQWDTPDQANVSGDTVREREPCLSCDRFRRIKIRAHHYERILRKQKFSFSQRMRRATASVSHIQQAFEQSSPALESSRRLALSLIKVCAWQLRSDMGHVAIKLCPEQP